MGIFGNLFSGVKNGIVFNETLDKLGVNFKIFPAGFQKELYETLRVATNDDPETLRYYVQTAAYTVAAVMSRDLADRIGFYKMDKFTNFHPFARVVVPMLERHGIPHHFVWPDYDADAAPAWAVVGDVGV